MKSPPGTRSIFFQSSHPPYVASNPQGFCVYTGCYIAWSEANGETWGATNDPQISGSPGLLTSGLLVSPALWHLARIHCQKICLLILPRRWMLLRGWLAFSQNNVQSDPDLMSYAVKCLWREKKKKLINLFVRWADLTFGLNWHGVQLLFTKHFNMNSKHTGLWVTRCWGPNTCHNCCWLMITASLIVLPCLSEDFFSWMLHSLCVEIIYLIQ